MRLPSAWHSNPERSATVSSTGCTSVGELLIARSTCAVAVWRSSACCVSVNRRTFSIAITAWSAKVRASAISLSPKSPVAARRMVRQPIALASRSKGTNRAAW